MKVFFYYSSLILVISASALVPRAKRSKFGQRWHEEELNSSPRQRIPTQDADECWDRKRMKFKSRNFEF